MFGDSEVIGRGDTLEDFAGEEDLENLALLEANARAFASARASRLEGRITACWCCKSAEPR